jgi:hypothetical protein
MFLHGEVEWWCWRAIEENGEVCLSLGQSTVSFFPWFRSLPLALFFLFLSPHNAGLCRMERLLPGVTEWRANTRQIKFQKTWIQSQEFDEIRVVQKLVAELVGISVTPWTCVGACFEYVPFTPVALTVDFRDFSFPSQMPGLYHD